MCAEGGDGRTGSRRRAQAMDVSSYVDGMRRRLAARAAREEDLRGQAREVAERVTAALGRLPGVRRVFLYGSPVYRHFHEQSDIDIAVEGAAWQDLTAAVRRLQGGSPFPLDVRRFDDFPAELQDLVVRFGELVYDRSGDSAPAPGRGADGSGCP